MNGRLRWGQALVVLVTVLAIGCSGGIGSRGSDAAPTVEELKRRVLDLQRRATINEVELTRLRQRVTELEAGSRASAKASSVRETPRTAEVERALMAPRKPPKIDETDLEPVKYAQSGALSEAEVILSPEGSLAPVRASEQAQSLYDRGYSLYHQGRFLDAETELRRFLRSYADTDLADNAQYWVGESRYARKDYAGALAAFRETVERFPEGNKVADALFKAGQCFEAQGDQGSALETYREVIQRYAETAAAARATERVRALR